MTPDQERQREHFNSIADRYHAARRGANHQLLKRLMWARFFRKINLRLPDTARVLEPMCGFADGLDILTEHMPGQKIEYQGYDYSERMVEKVQTLRPGVVVWQADATTYQPPAEYDLVILLGALHHVYANVDAAARNICHAVKPGGYLINLEPTHGNPLTKAIRDRIYRKNELFDHQTEQAFGVGELESLFMSNGMKQEAAMYPGLLSYILYYNPDAFPGLNIGGHRMVRATFCLDQLAMHNVAGRALSFATLSLWQKPL
jgi:SAM-dependent methyltransferase